ncbi:hypothetical protein [Aliivibrio logei]|uniref:hypothetical protein n=1 Tax=Aliivibrio logei TaxID=688 RepID=UPI0035C8A47A
MSNNYNKMHEKLVKNENDFVGMIAYSIYKKEKREAVRQGDVDIEQFMKIKLQTSEIKKYRKEATELTNYFLQSAADDEIKKIKEQLVKGINSLTVKDLPSDGHWTKLKNWHHSGAAGVIGNFWTGVIVAIFVWLLADPTSWENAKDSANEKASSFISQSIN